MFSTDPADDDDSPEVAQERDNDNKDAKSLEEPGPKTKGGSKSKAKNKKKPKGDKVDKTAAESEVVSGSDGDSSIKEPKIPKMKQASPIPTTNIVHSQTKYRRRSEFFLRNRLQHSKFYKEYWEACEADSHKRTREEVEQFLDELAQNGYRAHFLLAAAHRIQKRAKLASDYRHDKVSKLEDTLGPLTLVIPLIRNSTNINATDPDLYKLSDFFCSLATEDDDDGGNDAADPNEAGHRSDKEEGDEDDDELEKHEEDAGPHDSDNRDDTLVNDLLTLRSQSLFSAPFSFWGQPDEKTLDYRRQFFLGKSEEECQEEARHLAAKLRITLHSKDLERISNALKECINRTESQAETLPQKTPKSKTSVAPEKDNVDSVEPQILNPHFQMAAKAQFHWISSDFAQFLDYDAGSTAPNGYLPENDPCFKKSQKLWFRRRRETADILMDIQERLFHSIERLRKFLHTGDDTKGGSEEEAFVVDLNSLRRRRKGHTFHGRYEAILEQSDFVIPSAPSFTVMLENLPIDMTEEEIERLYSRCGNIRSISIQNQRLELDPGVPSQKQLKEMAKVRNRRDFSFAKSHLPRSPVYALLDFADEAGYKNATQPPLVVFGMIIQRHSVRSAPLQRFRSLYIEHLDQENMQSFLIEKAKRSMQIKFPLDATDIESELQKTLDPVWVTLESGEDEHKVLSSCEIRFPSFEVAWYAYEKLTKDGEWNHVHWLRSPKDSMEWWTRKRGFYT